MKISAEADWPGVYVDGEANEKEEEKKREGKSEEIKIVPHVS